MKRIKQQRPGYYSALRQNRKILNKRLRKLDNEIAIITGEKNLLVTEKNMHRKSTETINNVIGLVKNSNFWKRFLYLFTGNVQTLARK